MIQLPKAKDLLQKEMSRKDFLKLLGVGAVTAMGAGNFLAVANIKRKHEKAASQNSSAFGTRRFGV